MNAIFELQKQLTSVTGISGCEGKRRALIAELVRPYVDEIFSDSMGNLYAHKKGTGPKIMVEAHMDTLGFVAEYVDKDGFVKVFPVGGLNSAAFRGKKIRFENGAAGVLMDEAKANVSDKTLNAISATDFYADIGAESAEEAKKLVKPGDTAVYCVPPMRSAKDVMISSYCDDLIGCAVIIDAIRNAADGNNDMYYVFTVQEEVGCRGAQTAAHLVCPDASVTVEVVPSGDEFSTSCDEPTIVMGDGPVIRLRDKQTIYDRELCLAVAGIGEKLGHKCQIRYSANGSNNSSAIQKAANGTRVTCISIPTRYIHSQAEMLDLHDAAGTRDIIGMLAAAELPVGAQSI